MLTRRDALLATGRRLRLDLDSRYVHCAVFKAPLAAVGRLAARLVG